MSDISFLAHFINEEIYLIDEQPVDEQPVDKQPVDEQQVNEQPVDPATGELCLIVTDSPPGKADLKFLHKIFASVDVAPQRLKIQDFTTALPADSSKVFFFGDAHQSLEPYVIREKEGQHLVQAHSLQEISRDRDKKLKLWEVLQTLFPTPKSP